MKKLIVILTVIVALAVLVVPASAIAPVQYMYTISWDGAYVTSCDGFDVLVDGIAYVDGKAYFEQGNPEPVQLIEHWTVPSDTYYNSVTGKSVTWGAGVLNVFGDLVTGEWKSAGLQYRVVVPGEGVILLDVGLIKFYEFPYAYFMAGTHPVLLADQEGMQELCDYLAE